MIEKFLFVICLVALIVGFVYNFFSNENIANYIKSKNGVLVSTEPVSTYNNRNNSIKVKYYDAHKNLREFIYHKEGLLSSFGDDEIIEYSKSSPEYKESLKTENDFQQKSQNFKKVNYKVNEGILMIQQEYTQINYNEFAFLNGKKAPKGKYKLGFMNYVWIEDGKVKEITVI